MSANSPDTPERSVALKINQAIEARIDASISRAIDEIVEKRMHESVSLRIDKAIAQKVHAKLTHQSEKSLGYVLEQMFEDRIIFGSRWILAPSYLILILVLVALCYKTGEEFVQFVRDFQIFQENTAIIQALTIVDIVLVMNLVLMIMLVGYINFVSQIHPSKGEDWPEWTRHLDYSGLKLQLLGSITAIAAIVLLRQILLLSQPESTVDVPRIVMMIGITLTFVSSALIVAIVNKIKGDPHSSEMNQIDQRPSIKTSDIDTSA